jgi:hypothetical protein
MKLFHFIVSFIFGSLMLSAQSVYAVYGTDDVGNDNSEKTTSYGTEVEINEFVLLDTMPHIELYYYPYSATDADVANNEDVPGGAGAVYVGGGVIRWHANIDTTISIDDFTLTHTDTVLTERNTVVAAGVGIQLNSSPSLGATAVAALEFDDSHGTTIASMSADMTYAYFYRTDDYSSWPYDTDAGHTDFAVTYTIAVTLADTGSVQAAGTYQATATVRALPTVSN